MKELKNIDKGFKDLVTFLDNVMPSDNKIHAQPILWDLGTYLNKCNLTPEQIDIIIGQVYEHGQSQWSKGYDKGHEVAKRNLIEALNNV